MRGVSAGMLGLRSGCSAPGTGAFTAPLGKYQLLMFVLVFHVGKEVPSSNALPLTPQPLYRQGLFLAVYKVEGEDRPSRGIWEAGAS